MKVKDGSYTNGPMKGITSRAVFVIASDPALDAGERGNPVHLLETWGLITTSRYRAPRDVAGVFIGPLVLYRPPKKRALRPLFSI